VAPFAGPLPSMRERTTLTETTIVADGGRVPETAGLPAQDAEFIRSMATLFIDVLDEFGVAMARHIHEHEPRLSSLNDAESIEATRASCDGNMREIFSMLRAGLPAVSHDTPPQALEYARFLRSRGAGYDTVVGGYQYGVAMFRDVLGLELPTRITDRSRLERIGHAADEFLFAYIGTILDRLLKEFNLSSGAWHPAATDEVLANPASAEAARQFRDEQIARGEWLADAPEHSHAHAQSERVLDAFASAIESAADDPELSRRFALADTTVEVILADEPDLSLTLFLDRTPIEVRSGGDGDAEITLEIASFDLAHLVSGEFKLAMAIARGRVRASGPVRTFLSVVPILRTLQAGHDPHGTTNGREGVGTAHIAEPVEDDDDRDASGFSSSQRELLDEAAEYVHHAGALAVEESHPGDFWSVEMIDVYKAFGRNRVLNGLNLGIPEGMITVILGPSGTGKSVLINHMIGLMFPDHGDVLVHGRSVPERRRSELFEMRRGFGILFQDGALFGSLNIYDNVAFPLREQTNKSEDEIRQIVEQRLDEVGLTDAKHRMPSEVSGGMKKRAGFARALVMEPKIVMFDEPDSGLDPVRTALLCDLIRKIHGQHGGTYIVITHDIASARRLGDYIAVLWKGRIVESGDAERMFNSPNQFVRQFLAGAADGPLGME
jgi:phospholipid/cholesterol/gamma-HCH transport system ATP-binding protein